MTYGAETWRLTDKVCRQLNGANSIMLARITGKSFREEANSRKTSYDLVSKIRQRRMRWLGFILRQPQERLIHQAVAVQLELEKKGDLRMDAPPHQTMEDLIAAATTEKGAHWETRTDSPGEVTPVCFKKYSLFKKKTRQWYQQ